MATADIVDLLNSIGAKQITPPRDYPKKYQDAQQLGYPLLVAVLYTEHGKYFKEINDPITLRNVKGSPYAARYFHLSKEAAASLKSHPRLGDILG